REFQGVQHDQANYMSQRAIENQDSRQKSSERGARMNAQGQKTNAQEVIQNEQEYVLGVYSRPPFVIERGEGSTLYDTEGNAYIDCVSGIAVNALGYNDAGIAQAIQEAVSTGVLHASNLYHTAPHARLAKLLCETSFADKVHFSLT